MSRSPHLLIVGGGSAATSAAREICGRGGSATLIHEGWPLGGCCLHVGCVPSKYLIRAAERRHHAEHSPFPGLKPRGAEVDPSLLFRDLHARIAELRERNYTDPLPNLEGLRLVAGHGRLVDGTTVEVDGRRYTGDAVLVATGSRTDLAPAAGLPAERVLSNENVFAQPDFPGSLLVLGGGYIAVELAQMMGRFGVRVTVLQRSARVLSSQPGYVGEALGGFLRAEGMNLVCGAELKQLRGGGEGVEAVTVVEGEERVYTAEKVLMARGRLGNTRDLGLEQARIPPGPNGFLKVDAMQRTACPTVYAAGDVLGGHMLVYTASDEAERAVAHLCGDPRPAPEAAAVPWVVFTDPQVAGVGLSEEEARAAGIEVETAELPVSRWPRFSTVNEDRGFLRLIRDPATDTLVGARGVCPEAGDLVSELALIRDHRIPLREVATRLVPYLTLNEGIQKCAARFF